MAGNHQAIGQPFKLTDHKKVRDLIEDYYTNELKRMVFGRIYDEKLEKEVHKQYQDGSHMPGIAGVAAHLDISRRTFLDYCKGGESKDQEKVLIAHECLRAKMLIEAAQERGLFDKLAHRGSAFSLGVNYGWGANGDLGASGGAFQMNNIAPVANAKAIPKWEGEED